MDNLSTNPLAKHFRQPAIYYSLPSGGKYWPEGSLDLGMNGQLAIFPMTTRDEITIRTPDALLNGQGIVSIIQSCCPQIKDAWKMPSIDVDATLIAIRIASYGQEMDINTICSNEECKHENKHGLDLTALLDTIRSPNYNNCVMFQGLKIKLKPQSYFENNKVSMANFEEQRVIQTINDANLSDEERVTQFKAHMEKLIDINLEIISGGTDYIETEDGIMVTNVTHIKEFYDNADNKVIKLVREKFDEFSKAASIPDSKIKCEECGTVYPVEIKFDYATFFDLAS